MPFKWKKKTNRVPASPERMKRAVLEVLDGKKLRTTASKYNIDKMTLRRYVKKYDEIGNETKFSPNFNSSQIFRSDEEESLANYLLKAAQMNYGLSTKETRKFAYLYAVANNKKISANWTKNESASYEWLRGFLDRNKNLSLRTPEPTSLSRATAFNQHTVREFYNLLRQVLQRHNFEPDSIYNCDETGVQTVHKPIKIISKKGQKQVSKATSGERGQTVTVLCAVNASGNSVPPFFVFPRIREQDYMTEGAPVGSKAVTHQSGWMTAENFEVYLRHFIKFVKCSRDKMVLLVLDNHASHISPNVLDICKSNGIVLLTIPPHTSHRLQPLDVAVYGPFKSYYNQACDDFMINYPGQVIALKDIARLVGIAHQRAFTPGNITKGFSRTGICPYNSQLFSEYDFLTSSVTDREAPKDNVLPQTNTSEFQTPSTPPPFDLSYPSTSKLQEPLNPSSFKTTSFQQSKASTSGIQLQESVEEDSYILEPLRREPTTKYLTTIIKTPEDIKPFPKAPPRKKRMTERKPIKTKILTDTPNMEEIKQEHEKRQERKNIKSVKRNIAGVNSVSRKKIPAKKPRQTIIEESESDSQISMTTSSEELTDIEQQIENEIEEENFLSGIIKENDYVLVKFTTKKTVKHYVGQVLQKLDSGEYYVNFMRRKMPECYFVFPENPDQSHVSSEDVIKLPAPNLVGGTERATKKLCFAINFDKYDNIN